MAATMHDRPARHIHPVHTVLLVSILPLFLGALLSDLAYASSFQIQWKNFASWLIVGGLVFAGFALLWAVVEAFRVDVRAKARWLPTLLILATFVAGFLNALIHAKDAWSSMPAGMILSVITLFFALAAVWVGLSSHEARL